jgi:probable addiction module antidote protein
MSKKTTKTKPYDPGLLLTDDDLIADFLQEAMEDPDPAVFIVALGHAAKAKGIAKIATATGLGRTSLYKTFSGDTEPKWETIQKILRALDVKLKLVA